MTQSEIIRRITEAIDQGEYQYGDRLPSTRDLAERYGTTQQTVAAALAVMAGMGMVQVQRGWGAKIIAGKPARIRLGTFLSANREVPTGTTVWQRDAGTGAREDTTTVAQTVTTDTDADTGIPVGSQVVARTRTRYNADGAPAQHKKTLLTVEVATLAPEGWQGLPPMMSPDDVIPPAGMSIAQWLGMGVERVAYDITVAPAGSDAATALTMPEGTVCFRLVSRGLRPSGAVAYATVTTAPLRSSISLEIQDGDAE
jgi:GntR family transcriptional regulator